LRSLRVIDDDLRPIIQADAPTRDRIALEIGFSAGAHVLSWQDLSRRDTAGFEWRDGQLIRMGPSVAERTAAHLRALNPTTEGSNILIPRNDDGGDPLSANFRSLRELGDLAISPRLQRLAELEAIPAIPTVRISLGPDGLMWLHPCYLVDGREFAFDAIDVTG